MIGCALLTGAFEMGDPLDSWFVNQQSREIHAGKLRAALVLVLSEGDSLGDLIPTLWSNS
ncbi:hypothetical protein COMA1_40431 [Candidatus Nitrospira nitrosa]|uniref:Uncharacterized protein n=1 Tax=Candidatus Nitrospira nitrosa TaxID=1742972 RepID=A0A0S4LQA1_9BACT|nr:hypothetical protein COMA1_40431 [Candidatus Nitrospira nitrosa]